MFSPLLRARFDQRQLQVVVGSFSPFGSPEPGLRGNWAFGNIRTLAAAGLGAAKKKLGTSKV